MGNLRSVSKALEKIGGQVTLAAEPPASLSGITGVILPGVGHFGAAMENLNAKGWPDFIKTAIAQGIPYLGLCLGLQLLYEGSEEAPGCAGLGLLPGTIKRFPDFREYKEKLTVPHMGWNNVAFPNPDPLWHEVKPDSYFYFVHSYYAPLSDKTIGTCSYGIDFSAAIRHQQLWGLQFHPEKSQKIGLKVLENFINHIRS